MDKVTLDAIVAHVEKAIPYTPRNYPDLAHCNKEEALAFILGHALKHQLKSIGTLASALESFDHGNQEAIKTEVMRKVVVKLLGNAARLMPALSLSSEDVLALLKREFKGPPLSEDEMLEEEARLFDENLPRFLDDADAALEKT